MRSIAAGLWLFVAALMAGKQILALPIEVESTDSSISEASTHITKELPIVAQSETTRKFTEAVCECPGGQCGSKCGRPVVNASDVAARLRRALSDMETTHSDAPAPTTIEPTSNRAVKIEKITGQLSKRVARVEEVVFKLEEDATETSAEDNKTSMSDKTMPSTVETHVMEIPRAERGLTPEELQGIAVDEEEEHKSKEEKDEDNSEEKDDNDGGEKDNLTSEEMEKLKTILDRDKKLFARSIHDETNGQPTTKEAKDSITEGPKSFNAEDGKASTVEDGKVSTSEEVSNNILQSESYKEEPLEELPGVMVVRPEGLSRLYFRRSAPTSSTEKPSSASQKTDITHEEESELAHERSRPVRNVDMQMAETPGDGIPTEATTAKTQDDAIVTGATEAKTPNDGILTEATTAKTQNDEILTDATEAKIQNDVIVTVATKAVAQNDAIVNDASLAKAQNDATVTGTQENATATEAEKKATEAPNSSVSEEKIEITPGSPTILGAETTLHASSSQQSSSAILAEGTKTLSAENTKLAAEINRTGNSKIQDVTQLNSSIVHEPRTSLSPVNKSQAIATNINETLPSAEKLVGTSNDPVSNSSASEVPRSSSSASKILKDEAGVNPTTKSVDEEHKEGTHHKKKHRNHHMHRSYLHNIDTTSQAPDEQKMTESAQHDKWGVDANEQARRWQEERRFGAMDESNKDNAIPDFSNLDIRTLGGNQLDIDPVDITNFDPNNLSHEVRPMKSLKEESDAQKEDGTNVLGEQSAAPSFSSMLFTSAGFLYIVGAHIF